MRQEHHVSLKITEAVLERLEEQAASRGIDKTALAERYLAEAIAVTDHPGIVFRDGPAGRRAGVVGGPDVWEIIETLQDSAMDAMAAARYLDLPPAAVHSAIDCFGTDQDEIDSWLTRNEAESVCYEHGSFHPSGAAARSPARKRAG